jgi:hypothetical protein
VDDPNETACQDETPLAEEPEEEVVVTLEELKIAQAFIKAIQDASLDKDDLNPAVR